MRRQLAHFPALAGIALWTALLPVPVAPQSTPTPAPTSQEVKMKWFREAKFGLSIHWGLYSIPAGEWNGQLISGPGELIMNSAKIPVKEYEKLASHFNPVRFDAEEWVQLAEDAGTRYIVINAKDRDGFAMYRSVASNYNIFDATPFKRDPLKQLAAACAKHNIRLGFYYSQEQDWHEPNGLGNNWDFGPDNRKNLDQYLRGKAEPQVKELLTGYGPVSLLWFDTPHMMTAERAQRFVDIVHALQPAALINGRIGSAGDYVSMEDNSIPDAPVKGDWEVPATINHTRGFKKDDNDWKSPDDLTFKLVDIVSKGGNYLVNVGPTAEGIIPQPSKVNLLSVGRWLKVNGEAIYGAGPSPFDLETSAPWRCTTKPGKLFIHLFHWPNSPFALSKVKDKVTNAYFLADSSRQSLPFIQDGDRLTVTLPNNQIGRAHV